VTAAIRASALTKRYGAARGVEALDFSVEPGEVFGFLGPNGAGKTTTIRLLLDLLRPTSGRIELFGVDPRSGGPALRARLGYVPGDLRLYEQLTGREVLTYFAALRGQRDLGFAAELAERLECELDRRIGALSRGNRQKIGLVQALMHGPELLVLDEPSSGLDPLVQQVFLTLVREAAARGATVLLSSHALREVQEVADRVAVIREGELVLVDAVDALRARARTRVEVVLATPPPADAFAGLDGVEELERHDRRVVLAVAGEPDALVKHLASLHVVSLESREADLEDVFLSLYASPDAA
jgi:ABC-2 type transport system ATP-binding protein